MRECLALGVQFTCPAAPPGSTALVHLLLPPYCGPTAARDAAGAVPATGPERASAPQRVRAARRDRSSPAALTCPRAAALRSYVTLDQARSAVLMLERDPMAPTCPVVGAWVTSGDPASAPASDEDGGRVWAACQRFLASAALRDRVFVQSPEQRGGDAGQGGGGEREAQCSFLLVAVPRGRGAHACFHVTPRRVRWMGSGGGPAQAAQVEFSRWESAPCSLPAVEGDSQRAAGDGRVVQLRLRPAGTLRRRRAFLRAQGSDAGAGSGQGRDEGHRGDVATASSSAGPSWELRVPECMGDAAPAFTQLALPQTAAAPAKPQWVAAVGAVEDTQAAQRREVRAFPPPPPPPPRRRRLTPWPHSLPARSGRCDAR